MPMYVRQCKDLAVGGFYFREGKNTRSWVHIDDLMGLYVKLVEDAVAGGKGCDWGKEVRTIQLSRSTPRGCHWISHIPYFNLPSQTRSHQTTTHLL